MQNKLQELTEKIYKEGISRGNVEAEAIIDKAKKEADAVLYGTWHNCTLSVHPTGLPFRAITILDTPVHQK